MNTGHGTTANAIATYERYYHSRETPQRMRELANETMPPSRTDIFDGGQSWASAAPSTEVPNANGNDPQALIRLLKVRECFAPGKIWDRFHHVASPDSPVLDLLNIRFLLTNPSKPILSPRFILREQLPIGHIYENTGVLPRFFFVNQVRHSNSLDETLSILRSGDFDPRLTAVVEGTPRLSIVSRDSQPKAVRVKRYDRSSFELETETADSAFLVTSEPYYPGWRCLVDGKPQQLVMTNGAFRGLLVDAGRHHIKMEFAPRIFWFGLLVSLMASGLLGFALFRNQLW
jgi:hypothetical protein